MHEHTPELIIHSRNDQQCKVHLDVNAFKRENNTLMVGDLSCKKQRVKPARADFSKIFIQEADPMNFSRSQPLHHYP
jgi:bacillopeptidase F (M6 metalloprotease family)